MFAPGAMHASAINLGDPAGALLGVMPSPGMVPPSIVPVPGSPMVQLPAVPMPPGTPMVPGMPMPPGTPMIPGTTMPPVMIPGAMFQPVPVPTPQPLARPPSFPLSHPRTITTHYRVGVPIGQGGCAYVFRGQRRVDGMPVAIKFIERRRIPADRMVVVPGRVGTTGVATSQLAVPIEVYVLRQLDHPSIVKLVDFLADERYFYVVTELHGVEWRRRRLRSPPSPDAASQIASSHSSSQTDSASSLATGSSRDLFECIEAHGRLGEH